MSMEAKHDALTKREARNEDIVRIEATNDVILHFVFLSLFYF